MLAIVISIIAIIAYYVYHHVHANPHVIRNYRRHIPAFEQAFLDSLWILVVECVSG
jgi:hypothetical protein